MIQALRIEHVLCKRKDLGRSHKRSIDVILRNVCPGTLLAQTTSVKYQQLWPKFTDARRQAAG